MLRKIDACSYFYGQCQQSQRVVRNNSCAQAWHKATAPRVETLLNRTGRLVRDYGKHGEVELNR